MASRVPEKKSDCSLSRFSPRPDLRGGRIHGVSLATGATRGRDCTPGGPPPCDSRRILRDVCDADWYLTDARRVSQLH